MKAVTMMETRIQELQKNVQAICEASRGFSNLKLLVRLSLYSPPVSDLF